MGEPRLSDGAAIVPGTVLVRNDEPVAVEVEKTVVMMSLELGKYFGMNEVGSRIWELLAQPRSLADLCTMLEQEFDVEPEVCRRDVGEFVEALLNEQIIRIVHDPSGPIPPSSGA